MVVLCLALSGWQWQRAEAKQTLLDAATGAATAPLDAAAIGRARGDLEYARVRLRGEFLGGRDLLLDNRVRDGRVGYERLTPMRIEGLAQPLLVNRGWIPQGRSREHLPELAATPGVHTVTGRLHRLEAGWQLAETPPEPGWPKRVQGLAPDALRLATGLALGDYQLRLEQPLDPDHEVGWPVVTLSPARHRGYAVQWLLLAATLAWLTARATRPEGR